MQIVCRVLAVPGGVSPGLLGEQVTLALHPGKRFRPSSVSFVFSPVWGMPVPMSSFPKSRGRGLCRNVAHSTSLSETYSSSFGQGVWAAMDVRKIWGYYGKAVGGMVAPFWADIWLQEMFNVLS